MKIICVADVHIGQKSYGKIDKVSGLNEREINTINLLNETVQYTIDNHADAFMFAGDMYKNNLPSPTLINYVNSAFEKLSNHNIPTYVLDGNHDISRLDSSFSGLAQLSTLNVPNMIHDKFLNKSILTVDNVDYQVVMLPTYHTKEEITAIMDNLDTTNPTIVIGHLSINNAQLNDWNTIDNETCIDKEIFEKPNIKAVILGHFHKPQVLSKTPLTFYVGSLDRIDFSEEKQDKGFVELNIDNDEVNYKFVKLSGAQRFSTLYVNGKGKNAQEIEQAVITELNNNDIAKSIVRVRVDIDEPIIINEKNIIETAYKNNCQYILKLQKILPKTEVMETSVNIIDNTLSSKEAIAKYFEGQKREEERVKLGKAIIEEVENG